MYWYWVTAWIFKIKSSGLKGDRGVKVDGSSREQRGGATCGVNTLPVVGIHLAVYVLYCTLL